MQKLWFRIWDKKSLEQDIKQYYIACKMGKPLFPDGSSLVCHIKGANKKLNKHHTKQKRVKFEI